MKKQENQKSQYERDRSELLSMLSKIGLSTNDPDVNEFLKVADTANSSGIPTRINTQDFSEKTDSISSAQIQNTEELSACVNKGSEMCFINYPNGVPHYSEGIGAVAGIRLSNPEESIYRDVFVRYSDPMSPDNLKILRTANSFRLLGLVSQICWYAFNNLETKMLSVLSTMTQSPMEVLSNLVGELYSNKNSIISEVIQICVGNLSIVNNYKNIPISSFSGFTTAVDTKYLAQNSDDEIASVIANIVYNRLIAMYTIAISIIPQEDLIEEIYQYSMCIADSCKILVLPFVRGAYLYDPNDTSKYDY